MAKSEERKSRLGAFAIGFLIVTIIILLIAVVWGATGDMEDAREGEDLEDQEQTQTRGDESAMLILDAEPLEMTAAMAT